MDNITHLAINTWHCSSETLSSCNTSLLIHIIYSHDFTMVVNGSKHRAINESYYPDILTEYQAYIAQGHTLNTV